MSVHFEVTRNSYCKHWLFIGQWGKYTSVFVFHRLHWLIVRK